MLNPQPCKVFFTAILSLTLSVASAQLRVVSFGLFTGLTSTHSWDEGINADPRYKVRYNLKFSPIGFNYGVDYGRFGFVLSPSLFQTGQDFSMVNTVGRHEGTRKIDANYFNIPIALKYHLIDLDFVKTSFVIGAGPAFLLAGKEVVSHNAGKYYFPPVVYEILPNDYVVENDGVLAPKAKGEILTKNDFKKLQIFALIGIRSDWYFNKNWKACFDFRANYTVFDNRSHEYIEKLNAHKTIYDIPGKRRDIVGSFTIGVSRYIEVDLTEKTRKGHIKRNPKRYIPPEKIEKAPKKKSKLPH